MIDEELYSIDLNGNFGHTSLPMAFNFVSQRHLQRVRSLVDGVIDKYVDDYMMFSHDSTIDHVQSTNQECLRALFGPASVEPSKIVPPCKAANIIGWYVNLTTGLVRPNDKGINKLLFVFFFIDETQPQPLKAFQLMSSLAERYSLAIKGMRSLIDPITNMTRKWDARHPFSKRKADSSARFAIEMWRVVSILLWLDKDAFSVPIDQIAYSYVYTHDIAVITDASPWQLSAALLDVVPSPREHTAFLLPFSDPDNKYQNVKEFQGIILALLLILIVVKPSKPLRVLWVGDNVAALKWASDNKCSSRAAQYANIAYAWFQIYASIQVTCTRHCAGIDMGDIDGLSRDMKTTTLDHSLRIDLSKHNTIQQLFKLFDPTVQRNLDDHHVAYKLIHSLLQSLVA
jgi:hypothetical protein